MKLGALACLFSDRPVEKAIQDMKEMGIETMEIGCGGATGDAHCKPAEQGNLRSWRRKKV